MRPTPAPPPPLLRKLVWAGVGLASAAVIVLLRLPPKPTPPLLSQVLTLHATMTPERVWVDLAHPEQPHLERVIDTQRDAGGRTWALRSALFRLGRDAYSVHCAASQEAWPTRALPWAIPDHPDAVLFESDEWLVLGWRQDAGTVWLVGDLPAGRLREAAAHPTCPLPAPGT